MTKQRVILDANILYGSFSRDLLLSLFAAGMYEAKWTEKITQEWVGHLLENNKNTTQEKLTRTIRLMNAIPPAALVSHYEQFIEQVTIPDKDDRHVVAAAIACGAQKILTWNLGDFPNKILKIFGVQAESPDAFIYELLLASPVEVIKIFKDLRMGFKAPPVSVDGFFERLNKNNFKLTAKFLERYKELL
ncbi:PIN domain-containing protein [Massilia sp. W12]|uniref:PIN domain-containing protein n=1 Tax=Massilia sp. W12 TaxID=3126507 RepID=UPI0030D4E045